MTLHPEVISVIIPSYNAASFIRETVDSICRQEYPFLEIIIVDDGSTDETGSVVRSMNDSRIRYVYQSNQGVSAARNKGLSMAKGKYVIFFDADDKMSEAFIKSRLSVIKENPGYRFVCGPVETFPVTGPVLQGAVADIPREILHYVPSSATCPSNYLIERAVLTENGITFNEQLSSTADRFFLLQLNQVAQGAGTTSAPLLYRVSPESMSGRLTYKLVKDNEKFMDLVVQKGLVPPGLSRLFRHKIYYILGLGFIRTGHMLYGLFYTCKAFFQMPNLFIKTLLSRIIKSR